MRRTWLVFVFLLNVAGAIRQAAIGRPYVAGLCTGIAIMMVVLWVMNGNRAIHKAQEDAGIRR